MPDFSYEDKYSNFLVCGIDEAGRGPLAGPVVATCIMLQKDKNYQEINDSKKISARKRNTLYQSLIIDEKFGIGVVDNDIIDKVNILQATKIAMFKAYKDFITKYNINPAILLIDGNIKPFDLCDNLKEIETVIKGDQKSLSIAAASIIAKEYRDQIMNKYHNLFPNYNFNENKGYPTKNHIAKIKKYGIIEIHRKTFAPIKNIIA